MVLSTVPQGVPVSLCQDAAPSQSWVTVDLVDEGGDKRGSSDPSAVLVISVMLGLCWAILLCSAVQVLMLQAAGCFLHPANVLWSSYTEGLDGS